MLLEAEGAAPLLTWPSVSTISSCWLLVQANSAILPRSHTKAPKAWPAPENICTTGWIAPPSTRTTLRSSRTVAMGPPYCAQATLQHHAAHEPEVQVLLLGTVCIERCCLSCTWQARSPLQHCALAAQQRHVNIEGARSVHYRTGHNWHASLLGTLTDCPPLG